MFEPNIEERVIEGAQFIVNTKATLRTTAKVVHASKSTVFNDMTQRLPLINAGLYESVRTVLDINKDLRHIRGGQATKLKRESL